MENIANKLTNCTDNITDAQTIASQLLSALNIQGSYPLSQRVLNSVSDKLPAKELIRILSTDQLLLTRILILSNYSYYHPTTPITTLQEALDFFGIEKLLNILQNIGIPKNLSEFFSQKALASTMLQEMIFAGIVARELTDRVFNNNSLRANAYTFVNLISSPLLMLATANPHTYSAFSLDYGGDSDKYLPTYKKVFGFYPGAYTASIISKLKLPAFYQSCAEQYDLSNVKEIEITSPLLTTEQKVAIISIVSELIAQEICSFSGIQGIQSLLRRLEKQFSLSPALMEDILAEIPLHYVKHSESLGIQPLRLPEYLVWFSKIEDSIVGAWQERLPEISERIKPFLAELRQTMSTGFNEHGVLSHSINSTLNALVRGLNFDRALFFAYEDITDELVLSTSCGVKLFLPNQLHHQIEESSTLPDVQAVLQEKAIFIGEQIFADGWPFVAFPAIVEDEIIGVFYADKIRRPNGDALPPQEELACIAISEEWQKFVE